MKLSLDEIVALTGGKLVQSGAGRGGDITGLASLDEAGSDEVSFLGNEKYYQDFLRTEAAVVLIPPDLPEKPAGPALIEVANPSVAFDAVIKHFLKTKKPFTPGIHPSAQIADDVDYNPEHVCIKAGAIVEAGVSIGDGTEIGCGSVIGTGVSIGRDCLLHANVTVCNDCVLEDRVILHPGCVIGSDGYGYALTDGCHVKIDQVGIVLLEQDVEIGANTTIDRARFGKTIIGQGTKIDNLVQIAHNCRIGKHCLIISQVGISGSTHIGDYVTLAGKAGVAGHIKIGDHAVVTARTGVIKDLEGGVVYMGMPARPMREELKKQAYLGRLPKLVEELKALRRKIDELSPPSLSE